MIDKNYGNMYKTLLSTSALRSLTLRRPGVKTLRTQDTSDLRHFGTGAEVSGHFGIGAEMSVCKDRS